MNSIDDRTVKTFPPGKGLCVQQCGLAGAAMRLVPVMGGWRTGAVAAPHHTNIAIDYP